MTNATTPRRVILVGHCTPDEWMLRSAVKRAVPGAEIAAVTHDDDLAGHTTAEALLLVNRVLDGVFTDGGGLEMIQRLAAMDDAPAMLLVSDIEDAQRQADVHGARPGFGKTAINDALTTERIHAAATT